MRARIIANQSQFVRVSVLDSRIGTELRRCAGQRDRAQSPVRSRERTVSCRGGTQIISQRAQVGLYYASQIVAIDVDETTLRIYTNATPKARKLSDAD